MAFRLTPHERGFYPLFTRAAENIAVAADELAKLVAAGPTDRAALAARVKEAELAGAADDPARLGVVVAAAVAPLPRAELPGAQPDHRVPLAGGDPVDVAHAHRSTPVGDTAQERHEWDTDRPLIGPEVPDPVERADGLPVDAT